MGFGDRCRCSLVVRRLCDYASLHGCLQASIPNSHSVFLLLKLNQRPFNRKTICTIKSHKKIWSILASFIISSMEIMPKLLSDGEWELSERETFQSSWLKTQDFLYRRKFSLKNSFFLLSGNFAFSLIYDSSIHGPVKNHSHIMLLLLLLSALVTINWLWQIYRISLIRYISNNPCTWF